MILDVDNIQTKAVALQERQRLTDLHGTFESGWRAFRNSFQENEAQVVAEIVNGARQSYEVLSVWNLNETISFLKNLGRGAEITELLNFFSDHRIDADFWNSTDPFQRGPLEPELEILVASKRPPPPENFDVAAALLQVEKDFDSEIIAKLARAPVAEYYDIIVATEGKQLRDLISAALSFRRIMNATDDMRQVTALMEDALRMVGRESKLNALRIKRYGVSVNGD
jgi:hypothetical protein